MNWYLQVFKKYAVFSGRARRKEYWMFVLFNIIFAFVAMIIDSIVFGSEFGSYGPLYTIYALAILIPSIAVAVRRLHDIGRSGWWLFISLVPLIGGIILLIWSVREGDPGDNQYGPDPKEDDFEEVTGNNDFRVPE